MSHNHTPSSFAEASTNAGRVANRIVHARRRLRLATDAAVWEHLEGRTLMSAAGWTGAGPDANFSTPSNWAAVSVPANGDDVSFGPATASQAVTIDAPETVGTMAFTAGGYDVGGTNALTVGTAITDAGANTIDAPVTLGGSALPVQVGGALTVNGDVDDAGNGNGMAVSGGGTLTLAGTDTYGGATAVSGTTTLRADGLLVSDVTLNAASTLGGTGIVGSITSHGGTVAPGDDGTGDGTLAASGAMTLDGSSTLVLTLDGNTPGNGSGHYGQVSTGGDVTLNGAALSVALGADYTPAAGDTLTLVSNGGANAVTGTFAGLPEGSLLTLTGGNVFRISYAGGDGNDVTLSYVRGTTVTVTSNATPGARGQSLTFTASVAPTDGAGGVPTGIVTFYDNGSALGAAQAVDGSGNATIALASGLSVGTHPITAVYSGDVTFQTGTSAALSQVVAAATTTSAVASSTAGSSVFGQTVTFTATVAVSGSGTGTPTGSVAFKDGATTLATVTLDGSAQATFTTAALSTAGHSITVVYAGTGDFAGSTSGTLTQTVAKAAAGIALTSNAATTVFGQAVVYTATVTATAPGAGTPAGTVTFKDGATTIGTASLNGSGVATFTGTALAVGSHSITAVYGGNANFLTHTSVALTQTVNTAATRAVVTSSAGTTVFGQSVTLSAIMATVAPGSGTPTGSVTFYDGVSSLGTVALTNGRATLATAALSVASHAVTVVYGGDASHAGTTSGAFTQHVNKASLTVAVTSSDASAVWGEAVTYTVTANAALPGAGTPTGGLVTLTDENGNTVGTGTLSGGTVTITGSQLAVGSHTVTASYAGDGDFNGGQSAGAAQAVAKAATTVTLSTSGSPNVAGQSVTFTATVAVSAPGAGTPTGSVTFYDADLNHPIGSGTVSAGSASYTLGSLSTGTHTVFAVYTGDAHLLGGTSPTLTQAANQDATTTTLVAAGGGTSVFGNAVAFTATVVANGPGAGTPTGQVTFYADGNQVGSPVTVDGGGHAALSTVTLPVGTSSVTAVYGGDADFSTSTSGAASQVVTQATTTTAVTASVSPSTFGQTVTFTAQVTVATGAGVPSGTATFAVDGSTVAVHSIAADGTATYTTSALSVAGHTVDVTYSGDTDFAGSAATTLPQTVNAATTTTTVTSGAASPVFGEPVAFTVTVAGTTPGAGTPNAGGVTLFDFYGNTLGTGTVSGGTATISGVTLPEGSSLVHAVYAGTADYAGSTSSGLVQAVTQAATTLTLAPTSATVFGQAATLTATLAVTAPGAGTPTGLVSFVDTNGTLIGTAAVTAGTTATLTTSALTTGSHTITASYAGDVDFAAATTGSSVTQTVNHSASAVAVTGSATSSVYGQVPTFTVTVTASGLGVGTPSGTVQLKDGSTVVATGTLDGSGQYTFADASLGGLSVGSHTMTVSYAGDASFAVADSTGSPVTQTVSADTTTTTVTSSQGTAAYGQSVTFAAAVSADAPGAGAPSGSVTFFADSVQIGTVQTLSSGTASVTVASLGVGSPNITATYGGDADFTGGTSGGLSQTVTTSGTTATVAPTTPAVWGQPVSYTVAVAAAAPGGGTPTGGAVTLYDHSGNVLGTTTLSNGSATVAGVTLAVGSTGVYATYAGNASYTTATSAEVTQVVTTAATTLTMGATTNVVFGQAPTLTATLAITAPGAGTPTGLVSFFDTSGTLIGTGSVTAGTTATLTTSALTTGGHTITASYAGDADFAASTTASGVTQTVGRAAATVAVTGSATSSVYGQVPTFTVAVSATGPGAGTPSGTVQLLDGANVVATGTLDGSGNYTFAGASLGLLSVGSHTMTVDYAGDANFAAGNSGGSPVTQVVSADTTTTAVASSSATTGFGQAVTFTATVTPDGLGAGVPTGTVTFFADAVQIGTVQTLASGTATVTVSSLAVGARTITATFASGDGHFTGGTSGNLTQTVTAAATTVTLASGDPTAVTGESVTVTATVAPTVGSAVPTGTVTFLDNGVQVGSPVAVGVNGTAALTTTYAVGSHPLTATFANVDGNFAGSTTVGTLTQAVSPDAVTVAVARSTATSVHGQSVTFTATITPAGLGSGTPTGTVSFYADGSLIGTGTLSGGVATLNTAALTTAAHDITAGYGGDAGFLAGMSTDHAADVTVSQASSTVTVGATTNSTYGAAATLTATVAAVGPGSGTATGSVTFYADGDLAHPLGTATLSAGTATIAPTTLVAGNHAITAAYAGSADFLASTTAAPVTQTVLASNTTTALSLSSPTSHYNTAPTLTATVAASGGGAGTPAGIVDFFDGPTLLGAATLVSGQANYSPTGLSVGSHTLRAVYTGDEANNYLTSASATATETVSTGNTTTALSASVNPSVVGQQVTFTAAVASVSGAYSTGVTPIGGTVTFYDNGNPIGTGTVDGTGQATFATSALTVAGHPVTAQYGGDARYAASTSGTVSQAVQQGSVTISISSSAPSTAAFGQSVTLTASVNAALPATGNPTGTITFFADGVQIGSPAAISAGQAQVSTSALSVGAHVITATYGGDANFVTGTSGNSGQTVVRDGATVAVSSDHNPAVAGQTVRFTAAVSAAAPGAGQPTGTVTFYADGVAIAGGTNVALTAGSAFVDTTALSTAGHQITAVYAGDGNFTPATSNVLSQSQQQDATGVTLNVGVGTGVYGQGQTLTATVTANAPGSGTPTGSVTFYDNSGAAPNTLGQATMVNGVATLSGLTPHFGSYSVTAAYSGDVNYATATSTASPLTVTAASTTTTLGGDTAAVFGQPLSITATVAAVGPGAGTPSGTVAFYDAGGTVLLGSASLINGVATTITPLAVGAHGVTAVYTPGSTDYAGSTALPRTATVTQAATATVLSAPTATVFGQAATLTATVTATAPGAGTPTGTIAFYDGSTLLQTVNLNGSGHATLTTAGLSVATHPITAQYSGDANFLAGSPSAAASQVVGKGSTSGTLTADTSTSAVGSTVTFSATFAAVAPAAGIPSGTVTFYDGSTAIGTATLDSNGLAQLGDNALTVGTHAITASYAGNGNFNATATAPALSHAVSQVTSTTTLAALSAPSVWGQPVTLTATVTAAPGTGLPAGVVTFTDGSTVLGQGDVNGSGVATLTTAGLGVGTRSVTATYGGDVNHAGGASNVVTATVNKAAATVSVAPTTASLAGATTLAATVAVASPGAGAATGSVTFYDGVTLLGTADLSAGTATLAVTGLAGGDHAVTAVYAGDNHVMTATSAAANTHVPLPGVLQFAAASETVAENAAVATLTVTRTGGTEGAVSVAYAVTGGTAVAGTHYRLANGTVQFADGQASATIAVPVVDDGLYGVAHTLALTLSNPAGGAALGATVGNTLTIADADAVPTVSAGNATVTVSPNGNVVANVGVALSAPSGLPTTVHVRTVNGTATGGTDFAAVDTTVTIPAGQIAATVGVTVLSTLAYHPTRTFTVVPYAADHATPSATAAGTVTVLNVNYPVPTVSNVSATVAPGGSATFNPLATARSFDGSPLGLTVRTQPASGSVAVVSGKLVYTPAVGSFVSDAFTYTVTDAKGGTAVGTATVTVQGAGLVPSPLTAGTADLVVVGTAAADTITFKSVAGVKNGVRVTVNGVTSNTFTVTGRLVAVGGDGNDVVTASAGMTQNAWFYGGNGNDKLTGAGGNDVLIGGAGNDLLAGNGGRNVLIGGDGADTLKGSGAADMLVADATAYGAPTVANQQALAQIQASWVSHKLKSPLVSAAPGAPAITAATVTSDGSADVLVGKRSDWFVGDFTFNGGTTTFSDGRHAKPGQVLTPTAKELITNL